MFIHPSNMPISTAKCKKTGLAHSLEKVSTASTKISTDGVYAAAHFYNYEPELCRNTFLFSVWRMWCSSTTTPPEYYWTTSPTSSGLFHRLSYISVHVCLLVDLQTEVVLGVTWSLTRTCFELLRTLASKCHLVSDSMLGMNFQGSVRKYQRVDAKEIFYSGQLCQVHRTSKTFNWVHETGKAYQG